MEPEQDLKEPQRLSRVGWNTRLRRAFSNSGSRPVVVTAVIASLYWVLSVVLAPISYGPIQLRVACALYPLALVNPVYALGFGLGTFLTDLSSPFGAWDFVFMPFVAIGAAYVCWTLRRTPIVALVVQAFIIGLGVAIFPLGLGGGMPIALTLPGLLLSQMVVILGGWVVIWKPLWKFWKPKEGK